jgi:hypothetical protein
LANYALTARAGRLRLETSVCLIHLACGTDSLNNFCEPEDGEPVITLVALN